MFRILMTYPALLVLDFVKAEETIITSPKNPDYVIVKESLSPRSSNLMKSGLANVIESIVTNTASEAVERQSRHICRKRKKKKGKMKHMKYIVPVLIGWLILKSIFIPIALKGLTVLSGGSAVLSLLSLVLAAIMGIRRLITGFSLPTGFSAGPTGYSKYRRKDQSEEETPYDAADPYKYYHDKYDKNQ